MEKSNQLELVGSKAVAELFISTCARLRAMGATRVEGFGLIANFAPLAPLDDGAKRESPLTEEQRLTKLGLDETEKEMARRLGAHVRGGSAP